MPEDDRKHTEELIMRQIKSQQESIFILQNMTK